MNNKNTKGMKEEREEDVLISIIEIMRMFHGISGNGLKGLLDIDSLLGTRLKIWNVAF